MLSRDLYIILNGELDIILYGELVIILNLLYIILYRHYIIHYIIKRLEHYITWGYYTLYYSGNYIMQVVRDHII